MDALGRLAGGIAHDFNNLLTAILGNTELLLDGEQDQNDILTGAVEIHEAALLGAELVRQLLGFTRLKPGVARTLDIRRVARSAEGLLHRVIGEDVTLSIRVPDEPLPVRIDESQLAQVIMNLVLNAREAMPDGGSIAIEVFSLADTSEIENAYTVGLESDATGPFAALRVTDSGPGIEEELRPLVFEPFFTTKTRGSERGTGLGLSNVYAVVTRAGGSVSVSDAPGLGASITVLLPLQQATEDAVVVLDRPHHQATGEKVLVVEDDERVRHIAVSLLQRSGYQVVAAGDGKAALGLAQRETFDVLLVDVVMPGMDGKSLAARILEVQPTIGVLFMSGYSEHLASSDLASPGVDYIQKPFTREELDIKLQHVLSMVTER
jgi:CheY-like chemotaxis protein